MNSPMFKNVLAAQIQLYELFFLIKFRQWNLEGVSERIRGWILLKYIVGKFPGVNTVFLKWTVWSMTILLEIESKNGLSFLGTVHQRWGLSPGSSTVLSHRLLWIPREHMVFCSDPSGWTWMLKSLSVELLSSILTFVFTQNQILKRL